MRRFGLFLNSGEYPSFDSHAEILALTVRQAEHAERSGFAEVWCTEHHFIDYGLSGSALAMAGFLLGRTGLRVGTATTLASVHHPIRIAEEAALLDHLSGGRLDLGLGRGGYVREFEVFGVDPARYADEVELSLRPMLGALRGESVSADTPHFGFQDVTIRPKPATRPHPPVFLGTSSPATIRAAAREGLGLLGYWGTPPADRAALVALYDTACEAVPSVSADPHVQTYLCVVGDDDSATRERVAANLAHSFRLGDQPAVAGFRQLADRDAAALGMVERNPVGSPQRVAAWFLRSFEVLPAARVVLFMEPAGGAAHVLRSLDLFSREVMPQLV